MALIVTYNSGPYIEMCLRAVIGSGVTDVIVYDNASLDCTLGAIASSGLAVQVITGPANIGFGAAVNLAAAQADPGRDLLLVNPDCWLDHETLEAVLEHAALPGVGVCAPGMRYDDGRRGIAGGAAPTLFKEALGALGVMHRLPPALLSALVQVARQAHMGGGLASYLATRDGSTALDVDWVSGFCMLVNRACWDATGGFDTRIFMYFEDVALCAQARRLGWAVVSLPFVSALHHEGASSTTRGKNYLYCAGMWAYFRHHGTAIQRCIAHFTGTRS